MQPQNRFMMKHVIFRRSGVATLLLWVVLASARLTGVAGTEGSGLEAKRTYQTDRDEIARMAKDLSGLLAPNYRKKLSADPVIFSSDSMPFLDLGSRTNAEVNRRDIAISDGCVELVNSLSHAQAIDHVEKGYFLKYVAKLEAEAQEKVTPLSNKESARYWTADVMNEQSSNCNSVMGILLAIKLAHSYLGHYNKYESRITGQKYPLAINHVLTPAEFNQAFTMGTQNALEAGYAVEGMVPFLQAFDKMKVRPAWTAYLIPPNAKIPSLVKNLQQMQKDFFRVKDKR